MSVISIRLPDKLISEMKTRSHSLHISQTDYIRQAIEHMNDHLMKQERKQKLIQASLKVRKESMSVNSEFSKVEYDPKD